LKEELKHLSRQGLAEYCWMTCMQMAAGKNALEAVK
jgi:hypothetical protein